MGGAQRDPLVIDLTGQGLNLTPRSAISPYFDFTGSGFAHNTGWIAAGTGFLAIAGADGLVHDGTQLFGTGSQDGFAVLRALDGNGDGVIDASDAGFGKLVVWQDLNGNGVCEPGEVETLAKLGIASISLHTTTVIQALGNATITETALATMADGSTREVAEANLSISATYTQYVGNYTLDFDVLCLPELHGYGTLPSLWASMSQDGQLKGLVQQLVAMDPTNSGAFDAAMRAVLYRWAGVDGTAPASGNLFDGQELGFLRALLGNTDRFVGGQNPVLWGQANLLQKSWDEAYAGLKARILVQMPGTAWSDNFFVDPASDLVVPFGRMTDAVAGLGSEAPTDPTAQVGYWTNALLVVRTSVSDLKQFATPNVGAITASLKAVVPALFSPEVVAAAAVGTLSFVDGTALNGRLVGTRGADLFTAEQANSTLAGFGGGDEFIVGTGLGAVEIDEADNASGAHNVLLLTGTAPSQVSVSGDAAGDITLTLSDGGTVKLDGMLASFTYGYEQADGHNAIWLGATTTRGVQEVRFSDGTVWTAAQLVQAELSATGSVGPVLYGTKGADLLDGQGVKHLLQGNGGGDTFVFNPGYGALEIKEADGSATPANVLQLGTGIVPSQVIVSAIMAGDIQLTVGTGGDVIKLDGMLTSRSSGVQQVRFGDGTVWTAQQVLAFANIGRIGNTSLLDLTGGATLDPAGFAHLVTTRGGNDTVLFNAGYGSVEVNQRAASLQDNNVLQFGSGIDPSAVAVSGDANGNVVLTVGSTGDRVQFDNMLLGPSNGVQTVRFADGTIWSAQQIVAQIPGGASTGNGYFQNFTLSRQSGPVATTVAGTGEVVLGAGIQAGDAYFQTDAAGSLIVRLHSSPGDSLTVGNVFYNDWNGVHSRITQLAYADGTSTDLTHGLTFTWPGSGATSLAGSNDGTNVFDLALGTTAVVGASQAANTYVFHKGDGQVSIVPGRSDTVLLAGGIAASDVVLQADAAGDLTVRLLDTGDTLTVQGDLSQQWWGVQSRVGVIGFGTDAGLQQGAAYWTQGQALTFAWIGAGDGATLVGSGLGANIFTFGPGSTHVVAGNGSGGGSNSNTFIFDKGDGHATVDLNGGVGTIQLGSEIPYGDVTLQADAAGDLTLSLRDDPLDDLTLTGNFSHQWWGASSQISSIAFSDGTAIHFRQSSGDQPQAVPFTWTGTAAYTALVGSNFGPNTFDLGPGSDQVTFGNTGQDGAAGNTILFSKGDGHATVNPNGATGTVQLDTGITRSDVLFGTNGNNDLILTLRDTGDSLVVAGGITASGTLVQSVAFADGTTLDQGLIRILARTTTQLGTAGADTLSGGGDAVIFDGQGTPSGSQDHEQGRSGYDTFVFKAGYGQLEINEDAGFYRDTAATVQLGAGITAATLSVTSDSSGSLSLTDGTPGDQVKIDGLLTYGYGGHTQYGVAQVQFADGTALTRQQLIDLATKGKSGADVLYGSQGSDTFDGKGAPSGSQDYEQGNGGADTFVFKAGYGQLEINEDAGFYQDTSATLQLGAGVTKATLNVTSDSSGNAFLTDGVSGDQVKIDGLLNYGYGGHTQYGVAQVQLADGTVLTQQQVIGLATTGTVARADVLYGSPGGDTFDGKGAPTGSQDYEQGNGGADTFVFKAGYGQLEINEDAGFYQDTSATLQLGTGITEAQVTFTSDNAGNVFLADGTSGDRVKINGLLNYGYGGHTQYGVAKVQFADGTALTQQQMINLAATGTAAKADTLYGSPGADTFDGQGAPAGSQDYEQGNGGADTFVFQAGYGRLEVNEDAGFYQDTSATLQLGAGITRANLQVSRDADGNVFLTDGMAGDRVKIDGMLNYGYGGHTQYGPVTS